MSDKDGLMCNTGDTCGSEKHQVNVKSDFWPSDSLLESLMSATRNLSDESHSDGSGKTHGKSGSDIGDFPLPSPGPSALNTPPNNLASNQQHIKLNHSAFSTTQTNSSPELAINVAPNDLVCQKCDRGYALSDDLQSCIGR